MELKSEACHMTKRIVLSVMLICVLSFFGCILANDIANPTSAPRSIWLKEFLQNPNCPPPCWNNITPGQTTIDEAKEILEASPAIKVIAYNSGSVEWEFIQDGGHGYVESQYENNSVDLIYFSMNPQHSVPLEDVIENYSDPSFIHFEQNMHNLKRCLLFIYYQSSGLSTTTKVI